jgi:hypothetical protein
MVNSLMAERSVHNYRLHYPVAIWRHLFLKRLIHPLGCIDSEEV